MLPVTQHQPCSTILRQNDFVASFLQDGTYEAAVVGIIIWFFTKKSSNALMNER